jgi:hypothetical protein
MTNLKHLVCPRSEHRRRRGSWTYSHHEGMTYWHPSRQQRCACLTDWMRLTGQGPLVPLDCRYHLEEGRYHRILTDWRGGQFGEREAEGHEVECQLTMGVRLFCSHSEIRIPVLSERGSSSSSPTIDLRARVLLRFCLMPPVECFDSSFVVEVEGAGDAGSVGAPPSGKGADALTLSVEAVAVASSTVDVFVRRFVFSFLSDEMAGLSSNSSASFSS